MPLLQQFKRRTICSRSALSLDSATPALYAAGFTDAFIRISSPLYAGYLEIILRSSLSALCALIEQGLHSRNLTFSVRRCEVLLTPPVWTTCKVKTWIAGVRLGGVADNNLQSEV